ncbi:Serine-rich repeat adhesion protein [Lasiodiplodia theobromae]|uniref:Serine-rich repeat adhesion protein n=1 Tax=Lasiodiplodia theobromae TaxID=45133 RepID=UPI0015C3C281|nr:Serine-rich repeat adhesion protein [Lasiodiplodia theobromae]KAF4541113.1 Serine-rich repeat adhesion protein [Lasiodiplodia theobromae]
MSDINDRVASRSESSPTLPDIEPQAPLSLFQHPFGYDGDHSLGSEPEVYAVPDAVKDPGSTEVPRAVPIVEEQPRGSVIHHEAPAIGKGQRAKSKSSNSSSSSQSTSRPARTMPAIAVAHQTSTGTFPGDATPIGKQTTFVMRVPEEAAVYEVPITRRRSTTIKITVDNGSDESAHMRKASNSEFKTGTVSPSRRPISKANSAEPLQPVPIIKEDDTSTKRSKRSRIRALWRRLVAKIMMMKARKAAKASAPQTNV